MMWDICLGSFVRNKEVAEDKMVRQNHQLNGHESEQTQGDSERQGSVVGCSLWESQRVRQD